MTEKRVIGNTFEGTQRIGAAGGAEFSGGALLEDNLFEGNTGAGYRGTGIGGQGVLNRNRFFNNSGKNGGAVRFGGPGSVEYHIERQSIPG